jgi:hypothetical protein
MSRQENDTAIGAGSPAARLVAHGDALDGDAEMVGIAMGGRFQFAPRLALEVVADPAVHMRGLAGNTEQALAALVGLGPHRAAYATPMHDTMRQTADRNFGSMREWRRFR